MMISCKKAAELTCQSLDRTLSLRERIQLWMHLAMCSACNAFRKQSIELDRLIKQRFREQITDEELRRTAPQLPDQTCEKIKARLREVSGTSSDSTKP